MNKKSTHSIRDLMLYLAVVSLLSLLIYELTIKSNDTSTVVWGYSSLKLVELAALFVLCLALISFTAACRFSEKFKLLIDSFLERNKKWRRLCLYSSLSLLLLSLSLASDLDLPLILIKNRPFFIWLVFISTIVSITLLWNDRKTLLSLVRNHYRRFLLVFLGAAILLAAFTFVTGANLTENIGPATVLVTLKQGLFTLWIMLSAEFIISIFKNKGSISNWVIILTTVVLFMTAGLIWNGIQFRGSYNFVGPFEPGLEWFPHSDSLRFDAAAQSIFIGQGINYGKYVDNPLMVDYVALLHFFQGGLFSKVIILQVWIFALFPALIFILGKELFGFSAGLGSALLYIYRTVNILENTRNHGLASPKILLSESILEPILILLALTFLLWVRGQMKDRKLLVLIGGLFSLSALDRINVWFILPALILMVFFLTPAGWWKRILNCAILFAAVIITLSPWMWRSQNTIGTPFFMYYKFMANAIYQQNLKDISPLAPAAGEVDRHITREADQGSKLLGKAKERPKDNSVGADDKISPFIKRVGENFVFNFGNSTLILPFVSQSISTPSGLIFPDVVLKDWPQLDPYRRIFSPITYLLGLALLCLGAAYSLRKKNGAGFLLAMYFSYILVSAIAMTRGSRYTQPVEWIFLLLFSGGYSLLIRPIFREEENGVQNFAIHLPKTARAFQISENAKSAMTIAAIALVFAISALVIVPDYLGRTNTTVPIREDLTLELKRRIQALANPVSGQEIDAILASPSSVIEKGRIIYQLTLHGNRIYDHEFFVEKRFLLPDQYDSIELNILSQEGGQWVRINSLFENRPKESLVWKDALYIGCRQGSLTRAAYVVVYDQNFEDFFVLSSNPRITCN